ncbi:hypothetical protein AMECASPLE_034718 [Ameca splendens]|uniref:Uncharacterized protein n=1 Tax=Ameca splendens TaxID=208324 RepID=A0ABV0YU80_9TELE
MLHRLSSLTTTCRSQPFMGILTFLPWNSIITPAHFSTSGLKRLKLNPHSYWLLGSPLCNPPPSVARILASGRCGAHLSQSRYAF